MGAVEPATPRDEPAWHHNVVTRCSNWDAHDDDDGVPHPCPDCYSIETLSRQIPWSEPYTYNRPERSSTDAAYRISRAPDEETVALAERLRRAEGDLDTLHSDLTDQECLVPLQDQWLTEARTAMEFAAAALIDGSDR